MIFPQCKEQSRVKAFHRSVLANSHNEHLSGLYHLFNTFKFTRGLNGLPNKMAVSQIKHIFNVTFHVSPLVQCVAFHSFLHTCEFLCPMQGPIFNFLFL